MFDINKEEVERALGKRFAEVMAEAFTKWVEDHIKEKWDVSEFTQRQIANKIDNEVSKAVSKIIEEDPEFQSKVREKAVEILENSNYIENAAQLVAEKIRIW